MPKNDSNESSNENYKVRKHKQMSQLDHVKNKSMYTGSKKIQTTELFVFNNNKFNLEKMKFSPAWYKIIDEIIVNSIDQWVNYPKKVNKISISFIKETGVIKVLNTGPSIGIEKTQNLQGKKMYCVQLIASEFLTGDNLDEDDDDMRITGGTNGLGMKLTNAFSDYMTIRTVDTKKKKYYEQTFKNRLEIIEEPIIRSVKANEKESYTEIEFLPTYSVFGYDKYSNEIFTLLESLIVSRAYQALAFTDIDVYYNEEKLKIGNMDNDIFYGFSNMFLTNPEYGLINTNIISTQKELKKLNWNVCIGVSDGKFRQVSLINGINVYDGGNHIKYLQKQIVNGLKGKVEKLIKSTKAKFNPNFIINNLFIFFRASIVKPEFNSQIKHYLDDPVEKFESYKFKQSDYNKIWEMLEPHVMSLFLDKYKDKKKTQVIRSNINVDKCRDAKFAGSKTKSKYCKLIICEGDSAMGTVHTGIVSKKSNLDYDYYGTFSIQGVTINARKEVSIFEDKKKNTKTLIRSAKLQNNKRLSDLVKVLGLDFEKTYSLDKKGDDEYETLRYRQIIGAVDQDEDGKGFIFGLLINFFTLFWPNLIKRSFIKRFNTPIIRAYPKSSKKLKMIEFTSIKPYNDWVENEFKDSESELTKIYKIKYYKGLGSHLKQETELMFESFDKRLCEYRLDKDALEKLEAYFGHDTEIRKKMLSTPVTREETIGKIIDITEQLDRDLKSYQLDNISRKIPSLIDGAVPSRRKAIYAARKIFSNSNTEIKVNAFVNETSKITHYHHGEASLCGTVGKMAQEFAGARHLPYLRPMGNFGSRAFGGHDIAQPRYTCTKLNKRLCFDMFPKDDDYLLKHVFDDGERCEPLYYVPVIPVSIMEHMELPATGWKVKIWAREWKSVIKNVKNLIMGKINKAKSMKIWLKDINCEIRKVGTKQFLVGKYIYDKKNNIITITELPLGTYSDKVKEDNIKKDTIKNIQDNTSDDVKIDIYLTENGWDEINKYKPLKGFDAVETYFNLKTSLDENINMVNENGVVKEFKKYEHVIDHWFPIRKQLYADRIDRSIILTKLMIKFLKNIIRYSENHQKYNITPKTSDEKADKILSNEKYDTFNHTLLESPKYTEISELENLIINNVEKGTSYDYLLNLGYRQMMDKACDQRKKKLKECEDKLNKLLSDDGNGELFKGGITWLNELERLEKTITEGIKLGWSFGKNELIS